MLEQTSTLRRTRLVLKIGTPIGMPSAFAPSLLRLDAAVVIRETDDGTPLQLRAEKPLATDVEVVAVDQTVHPSEPPRPMDDTR